MDTVEILGHALGLEVEHLAAAHAFPTGGAGEAEHQLGADGGIGVGIRTSQNFEREGQQPIAGQNCGRLVELLVDRRQAAAQVVVVHRGQIVMDQRIAMDALERGRDVQRFRLGHAE